MSRQRVAWTALAVLVLTVVPLPALGAACGPGDDCSMMSVAGDHCRRTTVIVASDCCAEMEPATEAPQTTGAILSRLVAARQISSLHADSAPWHPSALHPATAPAARGTPFYTLFATLLN